MKPTTASYDASFEMHQQPDVSYEIKYGLQPVILNANQDMLLMKPTTVSYDASFEIHYQPDVLYKIKYDFTLCYCAILYV